MPDLLGSVLVGRLQLAFRRVVDKAKRLPEKWLFLVTAMTLAALVIFAYNRFLAVETQPAKTSTLIGLLQTDNISHEARLEVDVNPGSTTVSCTLKLQHSRTDDTFVSLPADASDVRGASLGFLEDWSFISRFPTSDQGIARSS